MTEDPAATPQGWRAVLARVSQVFGRLSWLAALLGSLSRLIYVAGEYSRLFVNTIGAWGMVFRSLGDILWLLALSYGTLAILLGAISLVTLWRRNAPTTVVRFAKVGFVLGCAGVAVVVLSLAIIPALDSTERPTMRATCRNNLMMIGVAMKMYAGENQGVLPEKLSVLYPEYVGDPQIFVCPDSGNKSGDPAHIDEWSDYAYIPGLRMRKTPPDADVLVCYEKQYRHKQSTRNEVYLDTHLETHKMGQPHQPMKPAHP